MFSGTGKQNAATKRHPRTIPPMPHQCRQDLAGSRQTMQRHRQAIRLLSTRQRPSIQSFLHPARHSRGTLSNIAQTLSDYPGIQTANQIKLFNRAIFPHKTIQDNDRRSPTWMLSVEHSQSPFLNRIFVLNRSPRFFTRSRKLKLFSVKLE